MELVDLYNARKQLIGDTCDRNSVPDELYRLSIHIWILNDKDEVLIQQRSSNRTMFPNMWSNNGGAALASESSLDTVIRELKEELNIVPDINNLEFIASYKRKKDFVDVWVLRQNINISDIILQKEEVQAVKWVTIHELNNLLNNELFIRSSYDYFIKYINSDY